MAEKTHHQGLETVETDQDFADLKTSGNHIEEVRIARLTEEDFFTLSKESLQWNSKAGFRLCLILFGMFILATQIFGLWRVLRKW